MIWVGLLLGCSATPAECSGALQSFSYRWATSGSGGTPGQEEVDAQVVPGGLQVRYAGRLMVRLRRKASLDVERRAYAWEGQLSPEEAQSWLSWIAHPDASNGPELSQLRVHREGCEPLETTVERPVTLLESLRDR